jgi:hypothetical protein
MRCDQPRIARKSGRCSVRKVDRTVDKIISVGLGGHVTRAVSVAADKDAVEPPIRFGYRTFDRQWIIPDHRLISRARPALWAGYSRRQVYLTALERVSPCSGPAISMTALIPDRDHYKGSLGGRVYPLWTDAQATQSNVRAIVLQTLARALGAAVGAEDLIAYIAEVMAHPAFTARFRADLVRPGLRLPLTAEKTLFDEAGRTKPMIGDRRPPSPLEKIQPDGWLAEYTEDLLNLLNVFGRLVALEPRQADLLDRIVAGPLVAVDAGPPQESGTTGDGPSS